MRRHCISTLLLLVTALACQREPAAQEAAPSAPGPTPSAAPAEPPKAAAAPSTYTVRIVPGAATAGQPATSVVEVSPAPGYKINLDFPARLKLVKTDGMAPTKAELSKEDAELTEKVLRFSVQFTPAAAGKLALAGAADFSVCNDSTCKLIRDEQLSWEVEVK